MCDRIHQPYRAAICPMLPSLLPLAGRAGILGAALSGAGPAILVVVDGEATLAPAAEAIRAALRGIPEPELIMCSFESEGTIRTCMQTSQ